jgi:hypothetical protein
VSEVQAAISAPVRKQPVQHPAASNVQTWMHGESGAVSAAGVAKVVAAAAGYKGYWLKLSTGDAYSPNPAAATGVARLARGKRPAQGEEP